MAGPLPPLTSSKARLTNPGIPLRSEYRGGESDTVREIPPEWRAALDLKVTEQSVPTDEPLFELTDEILASKLEQTFTSERKLRTTRKPAGVYTLLERFTNKDKEFGTRTRNFRFIDDFGSVAIPSAVKDVSTRNFGNKHFEEIIEEIPGVFNNQLYEEQIDDPVPPKFRSFFEVSTEEHTEPDTTASDPTLIAGDLKRSEQQMDLFITKKSHTFHDLSILPVTLEEVRMTPDQQIETIFEELDTDPHTITPDELTTEYDVQQIAGGLYVSRLGTVPDLFDHRGFTRDRDIVTPADFRAELQTVDLEAVVAGSAIEPAPFVDGDGLISQSTKQLTEFTYKASSKSIDLLDLPKTRVNKKTNRYKQVETVTRVLEDDTTTPAVPTALLDVDFIKLGDGTALEEQTAVSSIFTEHLFERSVPDVTPEWAKALLQTETQETNVTGTAADPTLIAGDLRRSEKQYDVFNKRTSRTFRDLSGLPKQRVGYRTNRYKQVETITDILEDDGTTPALPTALRDVTFEKLGDGTAVEQRVVLDEVFDQKSVATEVPDLLPDIFKAVLPSFTHEDLVAGISVTDPPVLATGDFFKSETRETEFTKKVVTRGRAGIFSLPASVTAFRRIGGEQFGAEVTKMDGYLDDSEPSVEAGLDVVSSKVTDLGNGTWFRETEKLDTAIAWPTLDGQYFDKEMQTNALTEEQTVDSSFTPATPGVGDYWVESKKTIDQYHAKRVKLTRTPSATDLASALVEEVDGPFQFPGLIYAVSGGYYRRQASAQLCQHIIRTWWLSSATKPTRGLPGSMADVEVQDIIMDDIIISSLNDVTRLEYSGMCLHDAITTFGTFVYTATTPSAAVYIALIGSEIVVGASIEQTDIPNLWKIQTKSVVAR